MAAKAEARRAAREEAETEAEARRLDVRNRESARDRMRAELERVNPYPPFGHPQKPPGLSHDFAQLLEELEEQLTSNKKIRAVETYVAKSVQKRTPPVVDRAQLHEVMMRVENRLRWHCCLSALQPLMDGATSSWASAAVEALTSPQP